MTEMLKDGIVIDIDTEVLTKTTIGGNGDATKMTQMIHDGIERRRDIAAGVEIAFIDSSDLIFNGLQQTARVHEISAGALICRDQVSLSSEFE